MHYPTTDIQAEFEINRALLSRKEMISKIDSWRDRREDGRHDERRDGQMDGRTVFAIDNIKHYFLGFFSLLKKNT